MTLTPSLCKFSCYYAMVALICLSQAVQSYAESSKSDPAGVKASSVPKKTDDSGLECFPVPFPAKDLARSEVYQGVPFQPGEESRYILKYGLLKVHVVYVFLRVQAPTKYPVALERKNDTTSQENRWHRVFSAEAYTGDWYKMIFAGHDKLQAFSRPWDFGVTKFYISQNEEKPFVRRFHAEKWLDFDHANCNVHERQADHKENKESLGDFHLQAGAIDAMGALYKLRTINWEADKVERLLVYTSEKNWWLEATQVGLESIKTPAGIFNAHKLDIKSYLGRELQQKGKLFLWIAADHPNHPMVRVEGELTFGSIYLELENFTPGKI
ncbi:MAG: DUF3108 domain-containing protein [Proteobacteria bacterium]|nr:DUF3108 domain-containing protein [Pseudomonadota bacterium]